MILSPSQEIAKSRIHNFLNDLGKKNKMFLLAGSAGTGKSTLISHILADPQFKHKKIVFSATTNKAVSILQKMCAEKYDTENMDLVFLTIHKLLKIKRVINKNGAELFQTSLDTESKTLTKAKSIFNYDIIIVDESSMISYDIMKNISKISPKIKGKIIFMGDKAQLPPVNETESLIFSQDIPKFELKEIMRYQGNLVLLANKFRDLVFDFNTKISFKEYRDKYIKTYSQYDKWIQNYLKEVEKLRTKNEEGSLNQVLDKLPIFLVYTNRMCDQINNQVRNKIFGLNLQKYQVGEIILFNNYYYRQEGQNEVKYYTSQKSQVTKIEIREYKFNKLGEVLGKEIPKLVAKFQIQNTSNQVNMSELEDVYLQKLALVIQELVDISVKYYILTLQDGKSIWVIHEEVESKLESLIQETRDSLHKFKKFFLRKYKEDKELKVLLDSLMMAIWEYFYVEVLDKFADISYGYAMTTHKSQGSTFKSIYLHIPNMIERNNNKEEAYRCLYTALTRSSKKVHLLVK